MGAGYQSNGTFGRVQTMQCTKDDPTGEKQYAKALLADLQDQWQAHTSGEVPLSPSSSLALRGELDRLSKIVYGDVPMMSAGYSGAETAYLAQQAENARRQANTIGMFAGGPVFAALPAAGRLLGAPEAAVESLGEINANLAGVGAMGRGRVAKKPSAGMAAPPRPPSGGGGASVAVKKPPVTRVGRWMSREEYEKMKNTGRVQPGAGDSTYGATSGPDSFYKQAGKGDIYVEYDVPSASVLPGSKPDWVRTIGPDANAVSRAQLAKQGGEFHPLVTNISDPLMTK